MKKLRAGDTLIVWKLDRPGRSLRDLITMLDDLRARGVKFHSLTEAIDTETHRPRHVADDRRSGRTGAQFDQRTDTRRSAGRAKPGVKFGRKPKLTRQQINDALKMIDAGERREDVAALLNVNQTTLYRALAG